MTDRILAGALFFGALLLLLPGVDALTGLRQGDEVMHIATVRESLQTDSWLLPQLTGSPNAYKPPLLFWMGMAGEKVFGRSLFADRFPVALLGAASAVLLFFILRLLRVGRPMSLFAALVFLLSMGTFKFARLLMMDEPMAFFLLLVSFCLLQYWRSRRLKWMAWAGFLTGVGFLYKGPLFHVYVGLLFLSGAMLRIWRPAVVERAGRIRQLTRAMVREGMVLSGASLAVPLIWVLWLVANGRYDAIWFFFVVENAGKFAARNQSVIAILWGWIFYTIPWTSAVAWAFWRMWARRASVHVSRGIIFSRVFLGATAAISLLHFLPDRKDPYYVIPALPLMIIGIFLFLNSSGEVVSRWRTAAALLVVQNSLLGMALALALYVTGAGLVGPVILLLVACIPPAILVLNRILSNRIPRLSMFASGLQAMGLLFLFQWLVLPGLYRADFPEKAMGYLHGYDVCLVSNNWWDVFELRLVLPDTTIVHSAPGSPVNCANGERAVVLVQHAGAYSGYREVDHWTHWSQGGSLRSVMQRTDWLRAMEAESYLLLPEKYTASQETGGVR